MSTGWDTSTAATLDGVISGTSKLKVNASGVTVSNLTASQAVVSDGSKILTSLAFSTANTGSTLAERDANGNLSMVNSIQSTTTTTSTGSPVAMNAGSAAIQLITGASAKVFNLPVATNMILGQQYLFNNNGSLTVTVNKADGSTLVYSLPPNSHVVVSNTDNSTSNGTWDIFPFLTNLATSSTSGLNHPGTATFASLTNTNGIVYAGTAGLLTATTVGTVGQLLTSNGTGVAPTFQGVTTVAFTAPTISAATLTTHTGGMSANTSGTYTTPTSPRSPLYLKVTVVGGGGGGGGSGTGTGGGQGGTGGTSTFGTSTVSCTGGVGGYSGGTGSSGGTGGTATLGGITNGTSLIVLSGGGGQQGNDIGTAPAGNGASTPLGGAGQGAAITGSGLAGGAGVTNSGSGGGGAQSGVAGGDGGGAGGYAYFIVTSPASTYAYVVGAAGTGGSIGTAGAAGGAGGSGYILVEEYYQ